MPLLADADAITRYALRVRAIKATVRNGQLQLEEPGKLLEGEEYWLVPTDADVMTEEERADLEAALAEGIADMQAGKTLDGPEFLARLRATR